MLFQQSITFEKERSLKQTGNKLCECIKINSKFTESTKQCVKILLQGRPVITELDKNKLLRNWNLVRSDSMMYLLNTDFTCAYITTLAAPVIKPHQSKFSQVAVLHARSHERHRNISECQQSHKMQLIYFQLLHKDIQAIKLIVHRNWSTI